MLPHMLATDRRSSWGERGDTPLMRLTQSVGHIDGLLFTVQAGGWRKEGEGGRDRERGREGEKIERRRERERREWDRRREREKRREGREGSKFE